MEALRLVPPAHFVSFHFISFHFIPFYSIHATRLSSRRTNILCICFYLQVEAFTPSHLHIFTHTHQAHACAKDVPLEVHPVARGWLRQARARPPLLFPNHGYCQPAQPAQPSWRRTYDSCHSSSLSSLPRVSGEYPLNFSGCGANRIQVRQVIRHTAWMSATP